MKNVNILHLYYDLMNLYGEYGNIIALRDAFKQQGIEVNIDKKSLGDTIDFMKYDIVYIGEGSEFNQELVRQDILKYKDDINQYIEKNKILIATGNSYELFGDKIDDKEALGIFHFKSFFKTITTDVGDRIVNEEIMDADFLGSPIVGFVNRNSVNDIKDGYLFKVRKGYGNDIKDKFEGIHYKNFFGTYLLGPLLIRNPYLLDYILSDFLGDKYKEIDTPDKKAYEEYLKTYNIE
jgi:CobQ-like glutamine amidotransferase family enzyme